MIAIRCYVEDIAPSIPAKRFSNAVDPMLRAGMPKADGLKTPSHALSAYLGLSHARLSAHDALDDALSLAYASQHLLREGREVFTITDDGIDVRCGAM